MKSETNSQPLHSSEASASPVAAGLSLEALQRRRALLRGLGKGSAVLAASVPIQTLAVPKVTPRLCSVSGVQSNVGSARTGLKTDVCKGYSAFYFKTLTNWPNVSGTAIDPQFTVNSITVNKLARFVDVFGSGSTSTFETLLSTAVSGGIPTTEQVWIAALLNGQKGGPVYPTMYSAAKVLALYADVTPTQGGSSTVRNDAFNFFKGYVQNANV